MRTPEIYTTGNGKKIECYPVNNDVNGNPRYIIHYLDLDDDYDKALQKSREFGGKVYRGNSFGGGIVFSSYSLRHSFKGIEFNEQ